MFRLTSLPFIMLKAESMTAITVNIETDNRTLLIVSLLKALPNPASKQVSTSPPLVAPMMMG